MLTLPTPASVQDRASAVKRSTAHRYGWFWPKDHAGETPAVWHSHWVRQLFPDLMVRGRVLDAGCGNGIDAYHLASDGHAEVVAIDISDGGARQTAARGAGCPNLRVLRGDLERLPMRSGSFDLVYSFGVLHHMPDPEQGFRELLRVLRPGGTLVIYVYEDFSTRSAVERGALRLVAGMRMLTSRMPTSLLYRLCQLASPLIFLTLTVPARLLGAWRPTRPLSERIPYRHGASPMGLTGDLYDRFAVPIERRYHQRDVERWFRDAACSDIRVLPLRGWVGRGRKAA